ncbi:MAG TPA: NAD(P)H-hydrate dehydratase [Acidimicrobiales bacterium]|nr:NAD(P)H-hydrate dehydratase [Acidimicrobiales bacterium]
MIPVVTPAEMAEIDRRAPVPVEVLIERAGAAVARAAVEMMGGTYGRRVVVVAGKGNNGADGRAAAARLRRHGVRVQVVAAADAGAQLPGADLVIDAAYGTGFRGTGSRGNYKAPDPDGAPVLAVDIPSGVNGLTGEAREGAVRAARTVTLAALKPGLLLQPGKSLAGRVDVVDIGLDTSGATAWLIGWPDVADWLPQRPAESHKWKSALWIVAGSPGMAGAAHLCARAAMRAGAGTVRLGIPGSPPDPGWLEVVGRETPAEGWDSFVLEDSDRAKAVVVGPGLARTDETRDCARRLVQALPQPVVIDADGLHALGERDDAHEVLGTRAAATLLTPHEGEFARLSGAPVGADRLTCVRQLAAAIGATVLLKGSTTIVAEPGGHVMFSTTGDSRLASAGTGDVLSGVAAAFLAHGLDAARAGAAAAFVHGAAGHLGWRRGLVAGDLLDLLPAVLNQSPESEAVTGVP